MRREDLKGIARSLVGPMKDFVLQSRVRIAVLINHSGQVLAHHGFTRAYNMANVATLAAATHSSSQALAELTGAGRWLHLHHAGENKQLFLAPFRTGAEELVLVAIFDQESTLGLVQLFFDRLTEAVQEIPELGQPLGEGDADEFERDLDAGIQRLLSEND